MVGHFLRFESGAAEYDAIDARVVVDDAFKGCVFIFGMNEIIDVVDILSTFVAWAYYYLFIIV